jgi:predicted  nucleic acid-binding Zn-ribbon protein
MSTTEQLRAVMDADRWVERVRQQDAHLPEREELATVTSAIDVLTQELRAARSTREPLQKNFETRTTEVDAARAKIRLLQDRLSASTGNAKELSALQHEIAALDETITSGEEGLLGMLEELEGLDEVIQRIAEAAPALLAQRDSLTETIRELSASLAEEVTALQESREQAANLLDGDLRKRYEESKKRVGISGAAQVDENCCDGCRIALSPLDFDRWRQSTATSLFSCPECGRLLLAP